jgi:N utilization substance protein B
MRHQAREIALQILFQTEFAALISHPDFLSLLEEKVPKEAVEYADLIVRGVKNHQKEIDAAIQATSAHWSIQRMSVVDRNVLRISIFEMKYSPEPIKPGIAINEAIELAKRYGSTDSSSFVNGILDSIAKGI